MHSKLRGSFLVSAQKSCCLTADVCSKAYRILQSISCDCMAANSVRIPVLLDCHKHLLQDTSMDEQPKDDLPSNTGLYLLSLTSLVIVLVWVLAGKWV